MSPEFKPAKNIHKDLVIPSHMMENLENDSAVIFPPGQITSNSYKIVERKAKALKLQVADSFPVWVPLSSIVRDNVGLLHFASWFWPDKPWQRLALGFTS